MGLLGCGEMENEILGAWVWMKIFGNMGVGVGVGDGEWEHGCGCR